MKILKEWLERKFLGADIHLGALSSKKLDAFSPYTRQIFGYTSNSSCFYHVSVTIV